MVLRLKHGHALCGVLSLWRWRYIQAPHLVLQVVQHLVGALDAAPDATIHMMMMMRRRRGGLLQGQGGHDKVLFGSVVGVRA